MQTLFVVIVILCFIAFLAIGIMLRKFIYERRMIRLQWRILNLDSIEAYRERESGDPLAFFCRKWREQDDLLRWRVVRFLDPLVCSSDRDLGALAKEGIAMVRNRCVIEGTIKKRRKFSFLFPFLRVEKVETEISFHKMGYPVRHLVLRNVPTELVGEVRDMRQVKRSLGIMLR